jgi:poly(A) polymerase
MIRAVKYASLLGFPFPLSLAGLVRRMREAILGCSRERVTEEVFKILTSGSAAGIFELAQRLRLFEIMFPAYSNHLKDSRMSISESPLGNRLKELDRRTAAGETLDRSQMFGLLFIDLVLERKEILEDPDPDFRLQQFIRSSSDPLFPSKKDLIVAAQMILNAAHPNQRARVLHRPGTQRPPVAAQGPREASAMTRKSASGGMVKKRRRRGRRRAGRGGMGRGPAASGPSI